nr:alanine--tRNA ligase [Lachnospiraceae bacterium]
IFDVDTVCALRNKVCEFASKKYQENYDDDVSIRLITDHIRSSTFMISDGIMPSNEGRGYVLRRLIRRAARHGKKLGIKDKFLYKLADTVIDGSKDGYPELLEKKDFINKVLLQEEEQFNKTIDQGLNILATYEEELLNSDSKELKGEDAFKLYDTYGFPLDLTKEILEEKGITVDEEGFLKCMQVQKDTARKARKGTNYMGADATVYEQLDTSLTSEFIGYDRLEADGKIIALCSLSEDNEAVVEALSEGETGSIITDVTPFYGTMGGQVGDKGVIVTADGEFKVNETLHVAGSKIAHVGVMTKGMIKSGDTATLKVDSNLRSMTCKNHSATHLLQKALRDVLGSHVEQAGSYQDANRTRFDFSHFQAMTAEELAKVEKAVNDKISEGLEVRTQVMSIEDAKKTGAMALFGEKYGDEVRVVSMSDYSIELCGGTHVANTSQIGSFKIISEAGVAAGVRRIEAITGSNVLKYYKDIEAKLDKVAAVLKSNQSNVIEKAEHLMAENKSLTSELDSLKSKLASSSLGDVMDQVVEVKGVKLLATSVAGVDMNGLRDLGDQLKAKLKEGVILLASDLDGKVNLVAMATDDAMAKGAHAGNLIKAVASKVGGGGGGRPNMAQAGGKNPAGIKDCLDLAKETLESQLS